MVVSKPVAAASPPDSTNGAGPTVEQSLYGLLLIAALVLRLFRLGSALPLHPLEAGQAWAAWAGLFGREAVVPALVHSPLLHTGQRLLFWLTEGGSDGWARAFPALAGSLLVLIPWLFRGALGRPAALALALLLAFDPWLLTFSRSADSPILSVGLALLLLAGMTQPDGGSATRRGRLAVAAGLFLVSGPLAWLLLPVLAAAWLIFRPGIWPDEQAERARLLGLAGVAALAGATGLLSSWDGLGGVSSSLTVALRALSGDGGYPLSWGLLRLAVDQPLLLFVGALGLGWAWRGGHAGGDEAQWRLFLSGWLLWGLLLLLLPGRNPAVLPVIGLPLLFSAARSLPRLLAYATDRTDWRDGSLIVGTLAVLLVTTAFWTSYYSVQWVNGPFDPFTLFFYGVVPMLAAFFVWWAGWRTSSQIFALLGGGLLFLMTLGSGWAQNVPGDVTGGSTLFAETGKPGLVALVTDVERLSALRAWDPHEAPVLVDAAPEVQPLLGWYLRKMRKLRFVQGVNPAELSDSKVLVVADEAAGNSLPGGYVGSRYPIVQRWLPTELSGGPLLRWMLLRELKSAPPVTEIVLWAREE